MAKQSSTTTCPEILGQLLIPSEAAKLCGVKPRALARLRRLGVLIEGIHYRTISRATHRYFAKAIDHYYAHINAPHLHQRWINERMAELD